MRKLLHSLSSPKSREPSGHLCPPGSGPGSLPHRPACHTASPLGAPRVPAGERLCPPSPADSSLRAGQRARVALPPSGPVLAGRRLPADDRNSRPRGPLGDRKRRVARGEGDAGRSGLHRGGVGEGPDRQAWGEGGTAGPRAGRAARARTPARAAATAQNRERRRQSRGRREESGALTALAPQARPYLETPSTTGDDAPAPPSAPPQQLAHFRFRSERFRSRDDRGRGAQAPRPLPGEPRGAAEAGVRGPGSPPACWGAASRWPAGRAAAWRVGGGVPDARVPRERVGALGSDWAGIKGAGPLVSQRVASCDGVWSPSDGRPYFPVGRDPLGAGGRSLRAPHSPPPPSAPPPFSPAKRTS